MPKSMARVLNAEIIRKTWKEKRKMDGASAEKTGIRKKKKTENISEAVLTEKRIMIKPGESLLHFERYVHRSHLMVTTGLRPIFVPFQPCRG